MAVSYLGIGSNLGNRRENIKSALRRINRLKGTKIIQTSKIIETDPVGGPKNQPKFLNAALKIKTGLSALDLLKELKHIEKKIGRVKAVRYGPRAIDLDILFYDNKVVRRKGLKIPHPKVFQRGFVLRPLQEII